MIDRPQCHTPHHHGTRHWWDFLRRLGWTAEQIHEEDIRIEWELAEIARLDREIVVAMSATGFALHMLRAAPGTGDDSMIDPTKDIVAAGTTRWFQYSTLPIGGKLKPGAPVSITTGDVRISLGIGVSPDGDPTKFSATVPADEPNATFGITLQGTSLDGSPLAKTFTIPIGPVGSTGGTPATDFDLTLLASAPVAPGGGGTTPPAATSISAAPSSISGIVGDPATALKITDNNGNDVTASSTYASADPTIATVDASGNVTLVGAGTTSINVTNGSLTTSVSVTSAAASTTAPQSNVAK